MTEDLFETKENQLLKFFKTKEFVSKADVMRWGLQNRYLRADRTVRQFVADGLIEKVSEDECVFRGLKGKMAWYKMKRG